MIYVGIVAVWLVIGMLVGLIEARHGYWHKAWMVYAIAGPFAIPLAVQRRRASVAGPAVLHRGRTKRGRFDVLVGIDGSAESVAAATLAADLFGGRVHRLTLATVLDYDTATPHGDSRLFAEPWPEETAAREALDRTASALRTSSGADPRTVLLAGDPAEALERYAVAEGCVAIVVGRRGHGLSKLLVGSCAARLQRSAAVPIVLVTPAHDLPAHDHHLADPSGAAGRG